MYQKHGEEGKHYCFGKGDLEAKCIEPGGGECGTNDDVVELIISGTPGTKPAMLSDRVCKYIHMR